MTYKMVICDDCEQSRYILRKYIEKININQLEIIGEAQDGQELISICSGKLPDIILLDIDMPGINGLDAAKEITKFLPEVSFIFITAYTSFAVDAFEVYPVDYIIKPVSIERLEKTLRYIISKKNTNTKKDNTITLISGHKKHVINQNSILFVERMGRKTVVHTQTVDIEVYEPINSIQERLDQDLFKRVHKSYLINSSIMFKISKTQGRTHEIIFEGYEKAAYISRNIIKSF